MNHPAEALPTEAASRGKKGWESQHSVMPQNFTGTSLSLKKWEFSYPKEILPLSAC